MKLWGGRFEKELDKTAEEFGASIPFDKRLYREDIAGSIAHAKMLAQQGIIGQEDATKIIVGLEAIRAKIERGEFEFRLDREDIHLNIEAQLREEIGEAAGRLHTGRSRNDQVALDLRLWTRAAIVSTVERILKLQRTLVRLAVQWNGVVMPGYTHMQRAQPILFSHHLLAYFEMFQRDAGRFSDCYGRVDVSPLGSGALAGVPYPLDREFVAQELG
ncbi:MAG: lyase family protein, partial [Chloroflexota bacterium]